MKVSKLGNDHYDDDSDDANGSYRLLKTVHIQEAT